MRWSRLFKHFTDRKEREDEWHRARQLTERVRIVETDMRAITTHVENMPDLHQHRRREA